MRKSRDLGWYDIRQNHGFGQLRELFPCGSSGQGRRRWDFGSVRASDFSQITEPLVEFALACLKRSQVLSHCQKRITSRRHLALERRPHLGGCVLDCNLSLLFEFAYGGTDLRIQRNRRTL